MARYKNPSRATMTGWIYRSSWRWSDGLAWIAWPTLPFYTIEVSPLSSLRFFVLSSFDHARPCAAWRGHFLPSSICLYKNSAFSALFMKILFYFILFYFFRFFSFHCVVGFGYRGSRLQAAIDCTKRFRFHIAPPSSQQFQL